VVIKYTRWCCIRGQHFSQCAFLKRLVLDDFVANILEVCLYHGGGLSCLYNLFVYLEVCKGKSHFIIQTFYLGAETLKVTVSKTRSLPFKWDEHFVPSTTECILACFAMSARYWSSYNPELNLAKDIEEWKNFAHKNFIEYRGTNTKEMLRKMPKNTKDVVTASLNKNEESERENSKPVQFSELMLKVNTPEDLISLAPFFRTGPPIPQILVFNKLLMTHNMNGPNHAVLLHSIDFEKEKLFVIDSTKHLMREPDIYDFRKFEKAWRDVQNLQIITYPKEMATLISGPTVGITKQLDLSQF
jgi:hypothetical protein